MQKWFELNKVRKKKVESVLKLRQPDLTVILENIWDPHNISAIMRSCDAVGISEIFVVNTALPKHQNWGFRSSAGALKWVIVHQFDNLDLCLAEVRKWHPNIYATHLTAVSTDLFAMDFTQPMALVFGNEHDGCSPEVVAACNGTISIPQMGMVQSLNVSVACAVTLYEALRQKREAGHYDEPRLPADKRDQIQARWGDYEILQRIQRDGSQEGGVSKE